MRRTSFTQFYLILYSRKKTKEDGTIVLEKENASVKMQVLKSHRLYPFLLLLYLLTVNIFNLIIYIFSSTDGNKYWKKQY